MVIRDGVRMTALGLLCGAAAAAVLVRSLRGLLFGVGPNDPATFISMAVLLLIIALIACALPARRAARVDPVEVLADG
jgi:ABC-type antimicrobial peptide transport system permease subunit